MVSGMVPNRVLCSIVYIWTLKPREGKYVTMYTMEYTIYRVLRV